jgi:hypothetical protein
LLHRPPLVAVSRKEFRTVKGLHNRGSLRRFGVARMRLAHRAMIAGAVSIISFEMSSQAQQQYRTRRVAGGQHMSEFLRPALFFHSSNVEFAFSVCYGVRDQLIWKI